MARLCYCVAVVLHVVIIEDGFDDLISFFSEALGEIRGWDEEVGWVVTCFVRCFVVFIRRRGVGIHFAAIRWM